jgi:hypothetical protein
VEVVRVAIIFRIPPVVTLHTPPSDAVDGQEDISAEVNHRERQPSCHWLTVRT